MQPDIREFGNCELLRMLSLDEIAKIEDVVNRNEDLVSIIAVLQDVTQKMLGFRCES